MNCALTGFSLPLARPLDTARGTIEEREGLLVTIETEGKIGVGEATPLPGWTEPIQDCRTALETALDAGGSPESNWNDALAGLDGTPAARHGLSLALADARSRADDEPLYRWLGSDRRVERVPVNATIAQGTREETAREACAAVRDGFDALKMKVGTESVASDAERLRVVREAVGPGVELRADANGTWTDSQAREALAAFEDSDVAYVEQPLAASDLAGHAALRADTGGSVGVALDETLAEASIEAVLDAEAADVVVLKPMALGGPDRTRAAIERAREAGVEWVVTTTIDGALARAGAVHVAASASRSRACGLATADRLATDLIADPTPMSDGAVRVPQAPGNVSSPPEPDSSEVRPFTEERSTTENRPRSEDG